MFLIYFLLLLAIPLWAQFRVKKVYRKYSQMPSAYGMSGAEVAQKILNDNGLFDVKVEPVRGKLSDHYDPRTKVVRLSEDNYYGHSIAGTAVAAHEIGHAIQHAEQYAPLRFRHALVPVASIGSNLSYFLIIIGILMNAANLILPGILLMAGAVLFQLVTLPVEFNASNRAMNQIVHLGVIRNDEERQAKKVLNAAALTYVASALVAVLELARFVLIFLGMNQSD
ncbi:zinc metallopeptidase [Pseudalkalibacillus salsuginis]|uniref:zinc metallopeptidase n=1 Tax=Pseudalkalibacillus salsuginis TaxID=2910972 RepID=UPI001F1B03AE|nr:zinc metallopeptidase [Pseudalkalibacillus salsuginis]MCF6408217.1 zinc metallopeptidase [Pseudalkalibacillus salsuginis]